jgi:signal transduction histidine kinase
MKPDKALPPEITQGILQLERRKAEFVATVSHDLKTPLNAIVGFTSVLLQDAGQMPPDWAHQLRLVHQSSHQLLERINDLLEFHRLEAGKIVPAPGWLSPGEVVLQALEPFRQAAQAVGVELKTELGGAPRRLRCDHRLLLRILRELLSNGVRFTRQGSVTLRVGVDRAQGISVRFLVQDTGLGLQAESLSTLRASLQAGEPLQRSYAGLGLGLALCREAAGLLGGTLRVEGAPDQGCTFTLALNLSPEDVEG